MQALEAFIYHDMIFKQRYEDYGLIFSELIPCRICTRIRYHPHQILCDTVSKLHGELANLKQLRPNDLVSLSAKSGSLEKGLRLLDEVINLSYCPQDDTLPMIELTPTPPCSFCGGELFRTVFCCTASCAPGTATDGSVNSKILLCNLCFVDGRTCRCGSMEPCRLQPLAELFELRDNVATLLGSINQGGPPLL